MVAADSCSSEQPNHFGDEIALEWGYSNAKLSWDNGIETLHFQSGIPIRRLEVGNVGLNSKP